MSIFEDFFRKERFIGNRRLRKNNEAYYRLWRNRIIKFLDFCDQRNVFLIRDIRQNHYDAFIAHLSKDRSPATVTDWKYALNYFFQRSHLPITVQTSPRKQTSRRKFKAYVRLRDCFGHKHAKEIMDLLDGIIR